MARQRENVHKDGAPYLILEIHDSNDVALDT